MKKIIPPDALLIPDNASLAFKGKIFEVHEWQQELFDGSKRTFEMLKRSDTSKAICIVEDKIVVIDDEQPHSGIRKSFPGGFIDNEDVSVLDGAKREVLEEVGYEFNNWRLVKVSQPHKEVEWFVYLFVAWDVQSKVEADPGPGEKITIHYLSIEELKNLIDQKVDYLGENQDLFKNVNSISQLMELKEYSGKTVDR